MVAQFGGGKIIKLDRSLREWVQEVLGRRIFGMVGTERPGEGTRRRFKSPLIPSRIGSFYFPAIHTWDVLAMKTWG
jgi:hypothetical protein